jgi:small subunit ribosomal protein S9
MADDEKQDQPEGQEPEAQDAPTEDAPAADTGNGEEPAAEDAPAEEPAAEQPAAEDAPAEDVPAEQPAADEGAGEGPRRRGARSQEEGGAKEEVIPGAHLEPDLVLEEERQAAEGGEYSEAGTEYAGGEGGDEPVAEGEEGEEPVAREPLDLAADARYAATGKRKTAVARVILKPGDGIYTINGRHLDQFFPRVRLQRMAQQPLETAGYNGRMDVVARIHGGGVSAQAGALRHGIARALVEADPTLRIELKRRGFLTRDPREKERKKAGLKKARKRPQFSKR